jgi:predicted nucleic acid-binding protein
MVAAVCAWHEHHEAAREEISRRLRKNEPLFVAGPALVEAYAVLTRLPPPHRLSAADAYRLIDVGFSQSGRIVALDGRAYRAMLRRSADEGISGGRTYDAVIAECALREKGVTLLTFDADDFSGFATRGLEVVVPGR